MIVQAGHVNKKQMLLIELKRKLKTSNSVTRCFRARDKQWSNCSIKNDPIIIKVCELCQHCYLAGIMQVCSNYAKNDAIVIYTGLLGTGHQKSDGARVGEYKNHGSQNARKKFLYAETKEKILLGEIQPLRQNVYELIMNYTIKRYNESKFPPECPEKFRDSEIVFLMF